MEEELRRFRPSKEFVEALFQEMDENFEKERIIKEDKRLYYLLKS